VTAFAMKGDEERIRKGGCEAYLSKPISVPKFIETIRRFLGVGLSMPAVRRGNATAGRSRAGARCGCVGLGRRYMALHAEVVVVDWRARFSPCRASAAY